MTDSPQSRFRLPHWGWFLLATVVLVVSFLGLSVWLPYYQEQQVVGQINSSEYAIVEMKKGGPDWLRQIIGDNMPIFDRVSSVELSDCKDFADADLARLTVLTHLESICLDGTRVTDNGLAYLSKCKNLTFLNLYGTSVTNAALTHLATMTNLTLLDIRGTQISPAGIEELYKALPNCRIEN